MRGRRGIRIGVVRSFGLVQCFYRVLPRFGCEWVSEIPFIDFRLTGFVGNVQFIQRLSALDEFGFELFDFTARFFTAFLRVSGTSSEILKVATNASRTAASLRSEAIVLFRARLVAAAFLTGFLRRTTFFFVAIMGSRVARIKMLVQIVGSPV